MGPGIFLVVFGALLTFAFEDHVPNLDLDSAGVILMLAGLVVGGHAMLREFSSREVTRTETSTDPETPDRVERRTSRGPGDT